MLKFDGRQTGWLSERCRHQETALLVNARGACISLTRLRRLVHALPGVLVLVIIFPSQADQR